MKGKIGMNNTLSLSGMMQFTKTQKGHGFLEFLGGKVYIAPEYCEHVKIDGAPVPVSRAVLPVRLQAGGSGVSLQVVGNVDLDIQKGK